MKSKLKRYILYSLLIIVSVLGIARISQAASGKVYYRDVQSLMNDGKNAIGKSLGTVGRGTTATNNFNVFSANNKNIYCIQNHQYLGEGSYYKVAKYIEISGKTATIVGPEHTKTTTNTENAKLAYVLGGGNYAKGFGTSEANTTARQNQVWAYWNTWAGKNLGGYTSSSNNTDRRTSEFSNITKEAKEYADSLDNNTTGEAYIKSVNKEVQASITSDDKEFIGPIKLNFAGTLSLDNDNGLEFYNSDKQKMNNGIKDVKSEKAFYIKNTTSNKVSKLKFNVSTSTQGVINARIWIIKTNYGRQRLIIADTNTGESGLGGSVEITVKSQEVGTLKIHKQDKSSQKALTGAGFKINTGTNKDNLGTHWLGINEKTGEYDYDTTYDKAKEFFVNDKGDLTIKNLKVGTSITVYETTAPKGYDLTKQPGYDLSNTDANRVRCNWTPQKISKKDQEIAVKVENSKTGNIEITKLDATTKEKLSGAGFKISVKEAGNKDKNIWLKQNDDKTYSYTASFKDATEFKVTDSNNGIYKIKDLDPQKYYIYEVTAPKGYSIESQERYDSKNQWVVCGSTDVESGNVTKVNIDNTKTINLEGYVWIEKPATKANEFNDLFDNGEENITDKVTITLRNKSDNSEVAKATMNSDRNVYRFEKIDYNKLKDYYVDFDYSKTDYKSYITVDAKFDVANGSKALAQNVPDYDKDLTGRATTYKGTADEGKYGLSYLATKFYNEKTNTVENVNLGIKELPETPFTVSENLAYIDMKIKGYNYRYIYGGMGQKVQTVPTIQWQSKTDKESYTRDIYPSDVIYENPSDKTQELQVYVTYRIDVTNNTNIDVPYLYQEKCLNVSKVLNKYDTKRYELSDSNWEATNENGIVQMKNEYLQKQYYDANKNGISNESDKNNKYAYITFTIRKEALLEMLKSKFGTIEEFPTEATVSAYHKYTRIDVSWDNNLTKTQTHYTTESTQSDKAPYLNTVPAENRKISGKVFEDKNARNNGELVGNGQFDQGEDKVQGVTVELGNYNDDGKFIPTDLYVKNEDGTTKFDKDGNLPKATMKTTEKDGTYSFEGVVPGEYFLRFTYGDGTQEIVNPNGNKKVSSDLYKSTIVTEEIKKAFETDYEATKATWYLGLKENHNMAVDDIKQRLDLSKDRYNLDVANITNSEAKNITAATPEFSVPIEFTDKSEGSTTEQYPAEFGYMDFGIIEMPNTRIGINKKITNIKLTYQNGQVAIDGNPATQNLAYTTDLDKKTNGGSKYVKVELDSEYIYGGTLDIRYEIEITNDSDLDYIEDEGSDKYGYYYKYGIKDFAHEKKLTIKDAIDYLDPKLSYKSKDGELDIKEIDITQFRNKDVNTISEEEKRILTLVKEQESISEKQFDKVYQINGIGELYSSKGSNKDKASKTVTFNAQKILSSQEDDLEFINVAEVTKIEVEPMTPANVEFTTSSANATQKIAKTPDVRITITPSTGADRSIVYFVAGTIALAVVAAGIVIIKKKAI